MQQCCRFQSYANSHAIAYEIYKQNLQSVNRIAGIHDNGPPRTTLWRLTLTAYWANYFKFYNYIGFKIQLQLQLLENL